MSEPNETRIDTTGPTPGVIGASGRAAGVAKAPPEPAVDRMLSTSRDLRGRAAELRSRVYDLHEALGLSEDLHEARDPGGPPTCGPFGEAEENASEVRREFDRVMLLLQNISTYIISY